MDNLALLESGGLGKIGVMSDKKPPRLTDTWKLNVRTTPEVAELWEIMVAKVRSDRSIRYGDKRPTRQAIFNAMILFFATKPEVEQRAMIAQGMLKLNESLGVGPEPQPKHAPAKPVRGKDESRGRGGKAG